MYKKRLDYKDDDDDNDDDDDDELFSWYGWPTRGVLPYFHKGPLSDILTIANLRQCREQDLNLRRTLVQALLNEVVQ